MSIQYLFGTSLLLGFTGALVPGPLLTVTLAESARWRVATGPAIIAGHAAVEAALVLAALKGLAAWLRLPPVAGSIALVGGLVLFWFAWGLVRDLRSGTALLPPPIRFDGDVETSFEEAIPLGAALQSTLSPGTASRSAPNRAAAPSSFHLAGRGALLSVTNPYWLLWWAGIGTAYLAVALKRGTLGVVAFFGGHILADFLWYTAVSLAAAGGGRLLSPGAHRALLWGCAAFLSGLGLYFFLSSWHLLNPPAALPLPLPR